MDIKVRLEKLVKYAKNLGLHVTNYEVQQRNEHRAFWDPQHNREFYGIPQALEVSMNFRDVGEGPKVKPDSFVGEFQEALSDLQVVLMEHGCDADMELGLTPEVISKLMIDMSRQSRNGGPKGFQGISFHGAGGTTSIFNIKGSDRKGFGSSKPIDEPKAVKYTKADVPMLLETIREIQKANPPKRRSVLEKPVEMPEYEKKLRLLG